MGRPERVILEEKVKDGMLDTMLAARNAVLNPRANAGGVGRAADQPLFAG